MSRATVRTIVYANPKVGREERRLPEGAEHRGRVQESLQYAVTHQRRRDASGQEWCVSGLSRAFS